MKFTEKVSIELLSAISLTFLEKGTSGDYSFATSCTIK